MSNLTKVTMLTKNPDAENVDFTNTINGRIISFNANPESINIQPDLIEKIDKVQTGYIRTYFDQGLVNVTFQGKIAYYQIVNGQKIFGGNIRDSVQWQWFANLTKFITINSPYNFWIYLDEYISNFGMLGDNPILEGSLSIPSYQRDVNNPRILSYSFNFKGIPKNTATTEQVNAITYSQLNNNTMPEWKSYPEKLKDIYESMTGI